MSSSSLLVLMLAFAPASPAQTVRKQHAPRTRKASTIVTKTKALVSTPVDNEEPATVDVLSGMRSGQLSATATGKADGRITLSLTNKTNKKLRVVLPPGLLVSGASGQFGGDMGGGMMGSTGGCMMGGMMSIPPTGPLETT